MTSSYSSSRFQVYPDFLDAPEVLNKKNTNPRYKFFRQNYFTAGDAEQFLEFWDTSLPNHPVSPLQISTAGYIKIHPNCEFSQFQNPCVHDHFNTFLYIFDKFKKGCYIRISENKMKVFLPFSKVIFRNEWYDKIQVNPKYYKNVNDMMKHISELEGREFQESRVHKDMKSWYGNNGLVRLEYPISESDNGYNMLKDMFECLTRERGVPEVDFYLNKRDFPMLKKDGTEAYEAFFGKNKKLLSHSYNKYTPILSMCTTDEHADIPIPTWEDWNRVAYLSDKKLFSKEFKTFPSDEEINEIPWSTKKPTAIFRGASTGLGTTCENNIRLYFAKESLKKKSHDGVLLIDAGITKWNLRPRKTSVHDYLDTIHIDELEIPLVESMSYLEQFHYKYIIHLPGHSAAYRLSMELHSGSLVLMYPSKYKLWYSHLLIPYEHYIPITENDIYDKIIWCKNNDEKVQQIVKKAKHFANTFLSRKGILDYLQKTLCGLKSSLPLCTKSLIQAEHEFIESELENVLENIYQESQKIDFDTIRPNNLFSKQWLSFYILYLSKNKKLDGFIKKYSEDHAVVTTKNTTITKGRYEDQEWIMKTSVTTWKPSMYQHVFLSMNYLNLLSPQIPHFAYCYGMSNNQLFMEFVEGQTLEKHLQNPAFTLSDLIHVWTPICLSLHMAQQLCAFMHMDLYPWNIILRPNDSNLFYQNIFHHNILISDLKLIPIIIDFEKSFYIHKGIPIYTVCPFQFCPIQDIICLVFSSLHMYLQYRNVTDPTELRTILKIMNFFGGTLYTNATTFRNIFQVKSFLKYHKKFSRMLSESKKGLENKTVLDFFYFLLKEQFIKKLSIEFSQKEIIPSILRIPHIDPKLYALEIMKNFIDSLDFKMYIENYKKSRKAYVKTELEKFYYQPSSNNKKQFVKEITDSINRSRPLYFPYLCTQCCKTCIKDYLSTESIPSADLHLLFSVRDYLMVTSLDFFYLYLTFYHSPFQHFLSKLL